MADTFFILLPETILIVAACVFFVGGSFPVRASWWGPLCLAVLALAAVSLGVVLDRTGGTDGSTSDLLTAFPLIIRDPLAVAAGWSFLVLGALFAGAAFREQSEGRNTAEFYGLLLTLVAGLMLVASANELILLFLALELISIPTYVLLYLGRRDSASQEAAIKYFLLSVMSAAVLLYGFSFLYGLTGSTNLSAIRQVFAVSYAPNSPELAVGGSRLGIIAVVLIFAGLGFKIAAVPFHFYAPDVYQGTTAWNAGLLAVAPKAAGFIALIRIAVGTMEGFHFQGEIVAQILALFTMTAGNVLALLQTNVRRLLAYSSIAHAGYMLIAIAVGFGDDPGESLFGLPGGVQACLFYLLAYSVVSVGLFTVLVYLARPGQQVEQVEELTGLWRTQPLTAICAALFLFSLAGMPPLPGFWGKLAIFGGALNARPDLVTLSGPKTWFIILAVVGVLNAAIATVYYLRIISVMFLHDPLSTPQPGGGRPALAVVVISAILTLAMGLQPGPFFGYLQQVDVRGQLAIAREEPQQPEAPVVQAAVRRPVLPADR